MHTKHTERRLPILPVLGLGLLFAFLAARSTQATDFMAWPKRLKITFSGYNRTETLADFPALVVLTNNLAGHFRYADMASPSDAGDLRFAASDSTTELNYEIDTWNPDGTSFIWVRVPQLASSNACIYAYWGNAAATPPPAYTTNGAAWAPSYKAVWHLGGAVAMRRDSTTNGYTGTVDATGVAATGAGMIGSADNFTGTATGTANTPPASGGINCGNVSVTGSQTIELWVNAANLSQRRNPVSKAYGGEGTMTIETTGIANYYYGTSGNDGGTYQSLGTPAATVTAGKWIHLALVRDLTVPRTLRWYVNGRQVASAAATYASATASANTFRIGKGYVYCFNGKLDEVRVASAAYSSNRVWACWMNTASNAVFQTLEPSSTAKPSIIHAPATGISTTSATLNASLLSTGAYDTAAIAYWGTSDGGTNTENWTYSAMLDAPQIPGPVSVPAAALASDTIWYYRFAASNEAGVVWSPATDFFITGELTINVVSNANETTLTPGSFTLARPVATTNEALTVRYLQTGGSATSGVDFAALGGAVTIPAGETSADIAVIPLKNYAMNIDTTLTLALTNTPAVIANPAGAMMTIINEPVLITVLTTNITRTVFGTNNAVIYIDMIDRGSTATAGIHQRRLLYVGDLTPDLDDRVTIPCPGSSSNDYTVTLEITDGLGGIATAPATVTLLRVESGYGAFTWNGGGVAGGTEDTRWLRGDNWRIGGVIPASPPGTNDDASISLNKPHTNAVNPNYAIEIGAGATARNVTFRNMNTTGRKVQVQGDSVFGTLDYATTRDTLDIVASATLTLTGGELNPATDAVVRRTLMTPSPLGSMYNCLSFAGKIRLTGSQVALRFTGGILSSTYIDNPLATVHFDATTLPLGGNLHVYGTQRMIGFNSSVGMRPTRYSMDVYSQNGSALTNWHACHVSGPTYTMSSGAPFTLPAGTYGSIAVYYDGHYAGNVTFDISGDAAAAGVNGSGYAVFVHRRRYDGVSYLAAGSDFDLNGHDLTVTGGGRMQVCEFTVAGTKNTHALWWDRIQAEGSAVTTDGDIALGPGGYFTGDAGTTITFEGDWDNRSQWQSNAFVLATSTLVVGGTAAPGAPQLLEAQSQNVGPTLAGMVKNHAIGRLEVGTPDQPTHAKLVDIDDYRFDAAADAFYVGELIVNAGASLDICGLELYVNGVSVRGHWDTFGAGRVTDSTIPSGTVILVR